VPRLALACRGLLLSKGKQRQRVHVSPVFDPVGWPSIVAVKACAGFVTAGRKQRSPAHVYMRMLVPEANKSRRRQPSGQISLRSLSIRRGVTSH